MLRIAIVDDDPALREQIRGYLARFGREAQESLETRTFSLAESFLSGYQPVYDIVLMDIDMPGINGLEAAHRMRQLDERVVLLFVTNLAQYALRGYEVDATDFVVKPLTYETFAYKMGRAVRHLSRSPRPSLLLKTEDGSAAVPIDHIQYVEVQGHSVFYHTTRGLFRMRGSLKQTFESLHDPQFFICNKCYIVNLAYVTGVDGKCIEVGGDQIEVSRPKKKALMDALAAYHNQV